MSQSSSSMPNEKGIPVAQQSVELFLNRLSEIGLEKMQKEVIFDSKYDRPEIAGHKNLTHLTSNEIPTGGITNLTGNLFHYLAVNNVSGTQPPYTSEY